MQYARRITQCVAVAAAAMLPAIAGAQLTYSGPLAGSGNGLGSVLTVLTLNNTAGVSTGCITPTATTCLGFADNVVQQSSTTRLISEVGGSSATLGTDIRVVANFSEPQQDNDGATVNDLRLVLFGADGGIVFESGMLVGAPQPFMDTNPGVGNIGFGFSFTMEGAAAFQNAINTLGGVQIGLAASLANVQGGLDTFQIVRVNTTLPPTVVPEPSTYALLATGLAGLGTVARRRRSRA
jgi:hypothetical protein